VTKDVEIDKDDVRHRFWTRRMVWGLNLPDHIFLGDAVILAGRKLHGEAWRDSDPAYNIVAPISSWYNLQTEQWMIRRACELLARSDEGYRSRVGEDALAWNLQYPSKDEWSRAVALDAGDREVNIGRAERFSSVCRELFGLFQSSIVQTFARPVAGGEPIELPPSAWFTEHFWDRFLAGRIDPDDLFQMRSPIASTAYLYVDRSEFMTLIEGNAPPSNQSSENDEKTDAVIEKIRRGRPPSYNWNEFDKEVVRRVSGTGRPPNMRAFSDEMLEWCNEVWGVEPAQSTVRGHIERLLGNSRMER